MYQAVSVIIVSYNTSNLLLECLNSIKEKTNGIDYEIIIIDNASSDDSVKMILRNFPDIKVIQNKENIGFGRANNLGAKIANGKYLFFLNSDTILVNNAIKIFYDFMEDKNNRDVGICGGNLFKIDHTPNYSYSLYYPSLLSVICYRGHIPLFINRESFNYSQKVKDVAIIIGADIFIRNELFTELNGFDPSIFMYVEDGDLAYRAKKNKYRIVSNPEAKIIHIQGSSSTKPFKLKMEISGYLVYFRKHHNKLEVILYKLIESFFVFLKYITLLIGFRRRESLEYLAVFKSIINM
jgi:GT2 family glycosyltransferase